MKTIRAMAMSVAMATILGGLCVVTALADVPTISVTKVTFRQRHPWNGLVDIDCDRMNG